MAPALREQFFTTLAGRILPGGSLGGLALPDLDDLNAPARMSFTLTAKDQGTRAGDYLVFTTPGQGGRLDLLLGSLLAGATAAHRSYPLMLEATVESRIRETVKLPPSYSALTRTCVAGPEGLAYSEAFTAAETYYSGTAYQGLRRLLEQRGRLRDGKVILMRQGGAQ
jgi:hypothetical protein